MDRPHLYSAHCRERFLLPGHHGYPRASDLIRDKALEGRKYIKITDATVRPFLHLLNPTRMIGLDEKGAIVLRDAGLSDLEAELERLAILQNPAPLEAGGRSPRICAR
jgi:hypothetical protein